MGECLDDVIDASNLISTWALRILINLIILNLIRKLKKILKQNKIKLIN
jgi:hypothetical protein